jgi:transposase
MRGRSVGAPYLLRLGIVLLRRNLRRSELVAFFRKLAPTEVVMAACGGSHHWARVLIGLGHRVRLIPAQYVKPFVKRGKNDHEPALGPAKPDPWDAEAICKAADRPCIHDVAVKSAETQARAMLLSVQELLVHRRGRPQHTGYVDRSGSRAGGC